MTNLGSVTGTPSSAGVSLGLLDVSDTDDAVVDVVGPSVQLIKTAGAAPDGGILRVVSGTSVTYSFQVTNSGDTQLINVAVTDNVFGSVGAIASLAAGASQTLTATATINADVTNLGTVTGTPSSGGVSLGLADVSDTDDAVVDVVGPSVQLTKTAGAAADGTVLSVAAGTSVTYSYQVTNTGDTELISVTATDNVLGSVGSIASLAAGASQTLTASATINADVTNIGTVTATPSLAGVGLGLPDVSDTDDAVVTVLVASISASPASVDFGDVLVGNTGTVALIVSNTGTTTLSISSISTSSATCPGTFSFSGITPPVSLAPGANITFNATFAPASTGACTGSLTITSNAATSPTVVSMIGTGASSVAYNVQVLNSDSSVNSPTSPVQVVQGASASATVIAIEVTGFSGRVNITVNGPFPTGLTVDCVEAPGGTRPNCLTATTAKVFLNQPQDDSVGFSFAADFTSTPGIYGIQIATDGGGSTLVTTVYIQIVPPSAPFAQSGGGSTGKTGKRAGSRRGRGRDPEPEPTDEPGEAMPADLDIVAAQVQLEPAQPQAGQPVRVLVPVRNLGAGPAENVTLALAIPAWSVRAEQTLSLAGHEGAVVEFAFDVPAGFAGGPVWARIVADPDNQVLDSNRANNRARVADLMPIGSGGAAGVAFTRGTAEFGPGDCVSFRLNGAAPADCGAGGDFELRADMGRLTLSADAVRDLGPGPLTGSASGTGGSGGRAAVQVGHVYEISGGARRAQVRVVRVQQSSARKPESGKAGGSEVPAVFDGPRVNDPFQLPDRNRARRPATIQVQVELEWVVLP